MGLVEWGREDGCLISWRGAALEFLVSVVATSRGFYMLILVVVLSNAQCFKIASSLNLSLIIALAARLPEQNNG